MRARVLPLDHEAKPRQGLMPRVQTSWAPLSLASLSLAGLVDWLRLPALGIEVTTAA